MFEGLSESLDQLLESGIGYWDLEHDYVLYARDHSESIRSASRVLKRDRTGLAKKIEKFKTRKLKKPELEPVYGTAFEQEVGLDDLLFLYVERVYRDSGNHKIKTSQKIRVNRNTVSNILRRGLRGKVSPETKYIKENINSLAGLTLKEIRVNYIQIGLEITRGNVNKTANISGMDRTTIVKHKDKVGIIPAKRAQVLKYFFNHNMTYEEVEKWYVVFLARKMGKTLGISPASLKTKIGEYVKDSQSKEK